MISKIRIKNFKAIKDSGEIILSPFTAIIGRNGSGKSSLIEAIEFLHDLVSIDLEHALQKWKSYKNILYNGNREQFDVTMDSLPKDMPYSKEPLFQQSEDLETSEEDSLQNNYEIENEEGYFLNGIFFSFETSIALKLFTLFISAFILMLLFRFILHIKKFNKIIYNYYSI